MSKNHDPLRTTAQELHRFWFYIRSPEQWYTIMRECRAWFGTNWRSMSKVRRRLEPKYGQVSEAIPVWFEVPDARFVTWVSVKYSLRVQSDHLRNTTK